LYVAHATFAFKDHKITRREGVEVDFPESEEIQESRA